MWTSGGPTPICPCRSGSDIRRAKALTTHDDYSAGILDAVDVAAADLDLTRQELLGRCDTFVTATTIVTNAVTEIRGARVGVIITKGFRDTFRLLGDSGRTTTTTTCS